MSDHTDPHATAHSTVISGQDPRIALAESLKFEPSELHEFELADRAAGQMMGKLLAFLFCILLFLMTGVNLWMRNHNNTGTDPQSPVGVEATHIIEQVPLMRSGRPGMSVF